MREHQEKILEALNVIKIKVPDTNYGICFNVDLVLTELGYTNVDGSNFVMNYFDIWFGNKSAYPVEGKQSTGSDLNLNKVGYENNPEKWNPDTKFGAKRIELLNRLIATIQIEMLQNA